MRAVTSLGEMEERLRRSLGLVGPIGTEFSAGGAIPVVIADDATRPGSNQRRNRAWSFGGAVNPAAAFCSFTMRATEPVIVDDILCSTSAAAEIEFRIAAQGVADPYALTQTAPFIEGNVATTDTAPLVWAGSSAAAAAIGARCGYIRLTQTINYIPLRLFLPTGGLFAFSSVAGVTGNLTLWVRGRLY